MGFIKWSEELSTNNRKIDGQHQKWISLTNSLNDAMHAGQGKEALGAILQEFKLYTLYHFAEEESAFAALANYPQAGAHIKQHQYFVAKLAELQAHFNEDPHAVSLEVMDFLKNWLITHITTMDITYKHLI